MISQIGGATNAYGSKQAAGDAAVAKPQAAQNLSVPQGDTVQLDGAGEDNNEGAGSPDMNALLGGLNENTADPAAANEAGAGMSHEEQVAYVEQEMEKTKEQIEQVDQKIQKIDGDIANYNNELKDIDSQISDLQGAGNKDGKTGNGSDQKISELNQKKTQINQRIQELEKEKKELSQDRKKLEDYLKKLEETWQKLQGHCNANRKVDMPEKPQTSQDKKNNDESDWQTKLDKDLEAVRQENGGKNDVQDNNGKADDGNAAQNIKGIAEQDAAGNKDAMKTQNGEKPGAASPLIDAINAAGRDKGQNDDGNGTVTANGVDGAQNGSTAMQTLKNDWEMCVQEGAEGEVSAETQKEVKTVLGITDDADAEGNKNV